MATDVCLKYLEDWDKAKLGQEKKKRKVIILFICLLFKVGKGKFVITEWGWGWEWEEKHFVCANLTGNQKMSLCMCQNA